MLIRPAPLPDELDRGYLGRGMRINGIRAETEMLNAMFRQFGLAHLKQNERAPLEALSKIAGLSTETFARQHSTLPLRRAITHYFPDLPHGSEQRRTLLYFSGMSAARPKSYFCPRCVKADIDFHGVAYWRRELQIPGRFWCPKHSIALLYANNKAAFLTSPAQWLDAAEEVPSLLVDVSSSDRFVNRFLEICMGLTVQERPLPTRSVSQTLCDEAERLGLKTMRSFMHGPLLSDVVRDAFPYDWLKIFFPDLVNKAAGKIFFKVDGVLHARYRVKSVWPYLLAAAVLYDDSDSALDALVNAPRNAANPRTLHDHGFQRFKRESLLADCISHMGKHSDIAKSKCASASVKSQELNDEELPDLTSSQEWRKRKDLAAIAFYIERKSVAESAQIGGLSITEMESIIRHCAPELKKTLTMMCAEAGTNEQQHLE